MGCVIVQPSRLYIVSTTRKRVEGSQCIGTFVFATDQGADG
jgi:hypothetical protein